MTFIIPSRMPKLFSISVTLAIICNVAVYHSYKRKGGILLSVTLTLIWHVFVYMFYGGKEYIEGSETSCYQTICLADVSWSLFSAYSQFKT